MSGADSGYWLISPVLVPRFTPEMAPGTYRSVVRRG